MNTKGLKFAMGLFASTVGISQAQNQAPNLIYVFPDQFRQSAMSFWDLPEYKGAVNTKADPVSTPNINKFASESLVFTSAVSNLPVCSPHRASLLTGLYPSQSGVPLNCISTRPFNTLPQSVVTFSDVLASNNYDMAYFGKWHLDFPTPNDPERPGNYVDERRPAWDAYTPPQKRHGFATWYSYGTFDEHKNPHYWDSEGKKHSPGEYSPKHEADKVIQYLKSRKDSEKPFAVFVSMNPPHSPYNSMNDCMEQDYNIYRDKPVSKLLLRDNADTTLKKSPSARYYFANVTGIDREFGRILEALREMGIDKNTIVVFSSDHGETMCSHGVDDPKNQIYDEAFLVPMLIRWPGKIEHRTDDLLIGSPDIMPTLLSMMGLKKDIPNSVQGSDYSSILINRNSTTKRPQSSIYFYNQDGEKNSDGLVLSYFPARRGIRTHQYTLEFTINTKNQLVNTKFFDNTRDPYQLVNLPVKRENPVIQNLLKEMSYWLRQSNDPWYKQKILSDWISY